MFSVSDSTIREIPLTFDALEPVLCVALLRETFSAYDDFNEASNPACVASFEKKALVLS